MTENIATNKTIDELEEAILSANEIQIPAHCFGKNYVQVTKADCLDALTAMREQLECGEFITLSSYFGPDENNDLWFNE